MRSTIVPLIIGLLAVHATAQDLELKRHTFGAAGGRFERGATGLNMTIGQPVVGVGLTESITHVLGFWGWTYIITAIDDEDAQPLFRYRLKQNYPNPFNPVTRIPYSIGEGSPVRVSLCVYDVNGRLVRMLVDKVQTPGRYEVLWDGLTNKGASASSGVYFYQLRAGTFVQARKLVVIE